VDLAAAVRELLTNALTYAGATRVEVRTEPGSVVVADDGVGIAQRERERVLGAFERGDTAEQDDPTGAGLGLYLAARLAVRLGGGLWLDSAPGEGATVTINVVGS
jgi:signal transduction histidine kinase